MSLSSPVILSDRFKCTASSNMYILTNASSLIKVNLFFPKPGCMCVSWQSHFFQGTQAGGAPAGVHGSRFQHSWRRGWRGDLHLLYSCWRSSWSLWGAAQGRSHPVGTSWDMNTLSPLLQLWGSTYRTISVRDRDFFFFLVHSRFALEIMYHVNELSSDRIQTLFTHQTVMTPIIPSQ